MGTSPQPGWYTDPQVPGGRRWWDGTRWTDQRQGPIQDAAQPAQPAEPTRYSPQARRARPQSPYIAQQGPQWGAYGAAGYGPPRRSGGGRTAVIVILVVGLVGMLVLGGVVAWIVAAVGSVPDGDGAPDPSVAATDDVEIFYIGDRPGFAEMREHITAMKEKYEQALADGSIYDYVEKTDDGTAYAEAFVYILIDLDNANDWNVVSTVAGELDAQIEGRRHTAEEYERRFLAGEDLGASVSITMSDGSTFVSDGVAPELVYDDPEGFAEGFEQQPDADGSYLPAAEELAAAFDMQLTFEYSDYADFCTPSDFALEDIGAVFCSGTPDLIYVNPDYRDYPEMLEWSTFVDMIRHELSHRRIFDHCGTIFPPIAGTVGEGVTNSYAVLYMGADEEDLGGIDGSYAMTEETYEIAEQIYNGSCG